MTDPRFGEGAQPPTDFERQLLRECTIRTDAWVIVGQHVGADVLFVVFSRISGMILSAPTPDRFAKRLGLARWSTDEVAARLATADPGADVWIDVGQHVGAESLGWMLGTLAGETFSAPSREGFVRRLYIPLRDQEWLALSRTRTTAQIAAQVGQPYHTVRKALLRALGTRRAKR